MGPLGSWSIAVEECGVFGSINHDSFTTHVDAKKEDLVSSNYDQYDNNVFDALVKSDDTSPSRSQMVIVPLGCGHCFVTSETVTCF